MPYAQYVNRHLVDGAIEGTNHGVNDRVIKERNKEAWKKISESLPDDAFADDVVFVDTIPFVRGFSVQ